MSINEHTDCKGEVISPAVWSLPSLPIIARIGARKPRPYAAMISMMVDAIMASCKRA